MLSTLLLCQLATLYLNRVRISSFAVYTYGYVIVTLDVAKWDKAAATKFKRTEALSKCIPNILQSEKKLIRWQCFLNAHKTLIT